MDYKKMLRLHFVSHLSGREIAGICDCGKTTANEFLRRFKNHPELSYPLPADMTNEYLEQELYKKSGPVAQDKYYRTIDAQADS